MFRAVVLATIALAVGCGTELTYHDDASGGGDGATTATGAGTAAGGHEDHPPCEAADGVRLCGGDAMCPALDPPDCPGYGCTLALDRETFAESSAGVCWSDVDGNAAAPCVACEDGQVCAQRYDDQLVCVGIEVCNALWDLGATKSCRYADKASYDDTALPMAPGCPAPSPDDRHFCGGDCPGCEYGWRCTGRSPHHPYGMCVRLESALHEPSVYPCALDASGDVLLDCSGSIIGDPLCAIWETSSNDAIAAHRYGMCVFWDQCLLAAAVLPGGVRCYDNTGAQVAP